MKKVTLVLSAVLLLLSINIITAQKSTKGPSRTGLLSDPIYVPSISDQMSAGTIQYPDTTPKLGREKGIGTPSIVPGKGSVGNDPLVEVQTREGIERVQSRAPITTFLADVSPFTPSDPTGAAGPDHYLAAWNTGFRVFNKDGTPATDEMNLSTLFPGNSTGDPIVFYDVNVDNGPGIARGRFVVTEFRNGGAPGGNGFDVAISAGPDPINDGWYVYSAQFNSNAFPDYTKFAVFGDSYVVTANTVSTSEQVFLLERNEMLQNLPAQFATFALPGIAINGFYSPHGFHTTGDETAPIGTPIPVVYLQDDAWDGVDDDHLKVWEASIDWEDANSASIELSQEITTSDFVSVFDGGSFANIPQLSGGPDLDALQATMMNQVQYRRFPTYNSVIMNFVVDVLDPGEKAGIRWYELRQDTDGEDWTIYQEGTYTVDGERSVFQGSMAMDSDGNIALGYVSSSANDPIAMHYTGRFDGDPLGVMTVIEQDIFESTAGNPSNRFADYTHLTLDPVDESFWFIAEQFDASRRDIVSNFVLDEPLPDDIGVSAFIAPTEDGILTDNEEITVTITNFGSNSITNPSVQYSIDDGTPVVETFSGTIEPAFSVDFTFSQGADLSIDDTTYTITASTTLTDDSNTSNDSSMVTVTNTAGQVCIPGGNCVNLNDGVIQITLADQVSLTTNCNATGYSDDSDIEFVFDSRESLSGTLQMGFNNSEFAIFVDVNSDAVFSSDELVATNFVANGNTDFDFDLDISNLDFDLLTAGPIRMRVRGEDESASGDVLDSCDDLSFGRTNDYTAIFNDEVLSTEENVLASSTLSIASTDNNFFDIRLNTDFGGRVAISIFNLQGQILAHNNLRAENGQYVYDLDMSYVSSGIYIVQFSDIDGNSRLVEKIIVE